MLWKSLLVGGVAVTLAIALFAALTLIPAPAGGTLVQPAPSGNVIVMPNGVAVPQLQPGQLLAAPALRSDSTSTEPVILDRNTTPVTDNARPAPTGAMEQRAVSGCMDK